jgi:hypothetical protein
MIFVDLFTQLHKQTYITINITYGSWAGKSNKHSFHNNKCHGITKPCPETDWDLQITPKANSVSLRKDEILKFDSYFFILYEVRFYNFFQEPLLFS